MYSNAELTKVKKAKSKKQESQNSSEYPSMQFDKEDIYKRKNAQNQTGIPNNMKSDFETVSGFSFDDVKVNYNSDKPSQMNAKAYAKGSEVFIGPGEEQSLPHELGHIVQQKKGIVNTTETVGGVNLNTDPAMEKNADEIAHSAGGKGVVQGDWEDFNQNSGGIGAIGGILGAVGGIVGAIGGIGSAVGAYYTSKGLNMTKDKETAESHITIINLAADEAVAASEACRNTENADVRNQKANEANQATLKAKDPLDALKAIYDKNKEDVTAKANYSRGIAGAKRACIAEKAAIDHCNQAQAQAQAPAPAPAPALTLSNFATSVFNNQYTL